MIRLDLLGENAPLEVLREAERYLEERKLSEQLVGTSNVRTGVYGPVSATYNLTQPSPQAPNVGMAFDFISFDPYFMNDAFARIVCRQIVSGSWYRPSDRLTDIKNGVVPHDLQVYRMIIDADAPRNSRQYQFVLSGPINSSVTIEVWAVSIGATSS